MTQHSSSSDSHWRSEEDYYLARLAVSMGLIDNGGVEACLRAQGAAWAAGHTLSFSQILVRDMQLPHGALLRLKGELVRCHHSCSSCGQGRYLPPGPQDRQEPCPRCGGVIPVPAAGSSLSNTAAERREGALHLSSSARFVQDPLATSGAGPRLFGHYILEQELARGGMGAVYRARDAETGNTYALKVLLAGDKASEKQLHRFRRESKAQMELDHPNIVKIHDAGEWEGILYYAMDLIEGTDLDAFEEMPLNQRLEVLAKVCRAIHHAHEKGYIHRDLKPANILLDTKKRPLVTDFGLTKNLEGNTQLTQEGAIMGTPFYMSPEQTTGNVEAMGPASDIFALGVLLYQFVTKELPFSGGSAIELYRGILEATPASFASHEVMAPELEQVAFKALQKDPALRYATALELGEDIERCMRGEVPTASSVSSASRVAAQVEKHKRSIGFIMGMVSLGLVLLLGLSVAFKVGRDKWKEGQALKQRQDAANQAIFGLDQALSELETMPIREASRSLKLALEAADAALTGEGQEPPNLPDLRRRRSQALLARSERRIRGGSGSGATQALKSLEEAWSDLKDEDLLRGLVAKTRASWRLGLQAEGDQALSALAQKAPGDARLRLLRAVQARSRGEWPRVLELLGGATVEDAQLETARAHLALGHEAEAQKVVQHVVSTSKTPARATLRWAEALMDLGRLAEAAEACARALEHDAGDLAVARRLLSVHLLLGRPLDAKLELQKARKRQAGLMELDILWLRARVRCGEDVRGRIEELSALPDAALLLGDLKAAAGDPEPYAALAEPSLIHQASAARWRVENGSDPGDLSQLARLHEESPRDRPPDPGVARAVRDLGWVYFARGDADAAKSAARIALRGLPGDLDTTFLLARLDPKGSSQALEGAFTGCESLQGALARGLLLGRLARGWKRKDLATPARRLLLGRLAGDPSLYPVKAELAALAPLTESKAAQAGPGGDLADWARILPPLPEPSTISELDRKRAQAIATKSMQIGRARGEESLKLAREALAIDPCNWDARSELATRYCRDHGRSAVNRLLYAEPFKLCPRFAFRYFFDTMIDWKEDDLWGRDIGGPADAAIELLKADAEPALHQIPWIVDRYFGIVYPDMVKPTWTRGAQPDAVIARIDSMLRKDPSLAGFLYPRAHLLMISGRGVEAARDLALVQLLGYGDPAISKPAMDHYDWLYTLWIKADQPEEVYRLLDKIKDVKPDGKSFTANLLGEKNSGRVKVWFRFAQSLRGYVEEPRFVSWEKVFKPVPQARNKNKKKNGQ